MTDPHAGHQHAPSAEPSATTYTCMHHPDIVSAAKGQCPKCGMDLVPKKPAASGQKP